MNLEVEAYEGELKKLRQQNADNIFAKYEEYVNKEFIETNSGKVYRYLGVLIADDDYYYTLYSKENGLQLLSCVGGLLDHGYEVKL